MTTMLEAALAYCRAGHSVVPMRPDEKRPNVPSWEPLQTVALTEDQIRSHWAAFPNDNIAIIPGFKDLLCVDGDIHKDGGDEALYAFFWDTDLRIDENTPVAISANGGVHYFFHYPGGVGSGPIDKTVDIKSNGGLIIVWPSVIKGKQYKWKTAPIFDFSQFQTLSDEVATNIKKHVRDYSPEQKNRGVFQDSSMFSMDFKITDNREFEMAKAVWRQGKRLLEEGHDDLPAELWLEFAWHDFSTLCAGRDMPLEIERSPQEMLVKIKSILKKPAKIEKLKKEASAQVIKAQVAMAPPEPANDQNAAPAIEGLPPLPSLPIEAWDFVDDVSSAPPEYVEGLLQPGVSVWYGQPNVGKTFVVFDLAAHIAWGRPWNGLEVEQGRCVYVAAEGVGGLRKRRLAFKKHYPDVPLNIPLDIVNYTPDLVQGTDTARLIQTIGDAKLVIIDTLAACSAGQPENESAVMTAIAGNAREISKATDAHVILVHHQGKHSDTARGHGALKGAIDTEVHITSSEAHTGRIKVTKQRDLEIMRPWSFDLEVVDLGENVRGKKVTSCVVSFHAAPVENEFTNDEFQLEKIVNNLRSGREPKPMLMQFSGGTVACRDHLSRVELKTHFEHLAAMGDLTEKTIKNKFSKAILGLGRKAKIKNGPEEGRPKYCIDDKYLGIL